MRLSPAVGFIRVSKSLWQAVAWISSIARFLSLWLDIVEGSPITASSMIYAFLA